MNAVAPVEPFNDPGIVDEDNPWPGLVQYGEPDQKFFFGRSHEIDSVTWRSTQASLANSVASLLVGGPDYAFSFSNIEEGEYTVLVFTYPAQTMNRHDRQLYGRNLSQIVSVDAESSREIKLRVE